MARCGEIKDGQQCILEASHAEPHTLTHWTASRTPTHVPGAWGGTTPAAVQGATTRRYRGSLANATADFQRDAANMAKSGYYPTSQLYAPGSWGCAAFLVALILCVVLVGILVFIYLLVVKPDGELVVTYQYRPPTVAPIPLQSADPASDLARLTNLRDTGLITPEEYAAKRAEIMARL